MRTSLSLLLLAGLSTACTGEPGAPGGPASPGTLPVASIQDAASGGTRHFFFLPPLVPAPVTSGVFDATRQPVVEICAWSGGACAGPFLARFGGDAGAGSERIRVDLGDELYIVNWHTAETLDPAAVYRIRVLVEGIEVGHADVRAAATGGDLRGLDPSQYVGVVAGSTLPIKFRIEQGLISCEPQLGVSGNNLQLELRAGAIPFNPTTGNAGVFKGTPVLFAGGLVYGTELADLVLGYNTANGASDFDPSVPICVVRAPNLVRSRAEPVVTNPAAPSLHLVQESFAYQDPPDDDYVVLRYTVTNTGPAPVVGLRVGLVFDWDVYFSGAARDFANDVVRYLPSVDAGFIGEQDTGLGGAGFAAADPLSSYGGYINGQNGGREPLREFYWGFLSGPVNAAPVGPGDVRQIGGVGPVDLAPGASRTFVFFVSGGDNLSDFAANIGRARQVVPGP